MPPPSEPFIPGGFGPPPGFRTDPQPAAPVPGYGAPMPGRMRGPGGFGRFLKSAVIGGAAGGLLSAIPLVNILNCCFCLLNLGGVTLGLHLYLRAHPDEGITQSESALFGGVAGAIAGLVTSLTGLVFGIFVQSVTASFYHSLPPDLARTFTQSSAESLVAVPGYIVAYGLAGTLGGVACMQLFFKDRVAPG